MTYREKTAFAAIDIGTTTIQAQLIDPDTGKPLDSLSGLSKQRSFGADVMSRISAAQNGKLDGLFLTINNQVEVILKTFILKNNLAGIEKCVISGNTTMLHLFCHTDPSTMGSAPYKCVFLNERNFAGSDLSLPADHITLLPGISAFVGADVVSGLALIDITRKEQDAFFVDIGTNGEMAVWKNGEKRLLCCSTAAGPCFEEAEISCGLTAADFIDAIAEMKRKSVIDETGALADEYAQNGYPVTERNIITQKDVRQFQLAKSALYSGIRTLCKTAKVKPADIKTAYIAGGLGDFLNLENAAYVGLLPREIAANAIVCGNTSLKGAVQSLIDPGFLPRCREIIASSETVELSNDKFFAAAFAHNMYI